MSELITVGEAPVGLFHLVKSQELICLSEYTGEDIRCAYVVKTGKMWVGSNDDKGSPIEIDGLLSERSCYRNLLEDALFLHDNLRHSGNLPDGAYTRMDNFKRQCEASVNLTTRWNVENYR